MAITTAKAALKNATTATKNDNQKEYFWNGLRISGSFVVTKVLGLQTKNDTTYCQFYLSQSVNQNQDNCMVMTCFDNEDKTIASTMSDKIKPGAVVDLRNVQVTYKPFQREDGSLGVSGNVKINSWGKFEVLSWGKQSS